MNYKSGVLLIVLMLFGVCLFAGTLDSIGVSKINNKLHVRYLVSPGETIYGISSKYGVPVSDLMELNPELENGLKVGQVINIPYNPETIRPVKKYDDNVIVHKVQPGETFYGLSKKYNTTVGDLMKMNNLELKAGQEIVVGYKDQVVKNNTTTNTTTTTNTNSTNTNTVQNNVVENNTTTNNTTTTNNNTETKVNNNTTTTNTTDTKINNQSAETEIKNTVAEAPKVAEIYPYDPDRKQVLIIPFDPYLYFSDADDEIAARSDMPRTKVRQIFRKRLNALLDAPGFETIHLLGGKAKDSLTDLNKIYGMVTYNYQPAVVGPYYKEEPEAKVEASKANNKNWITRQKEKITNPSTAKYDIPTDLGSFFGVVIKNPDFYTYFNNKYSIDYYIFVSQFEVKTNYENCLDRAALNYERTFTTHFSIFDNTGKQIAGNKFKTHYNSNSNYVYQIVSDNMDKIAKRILAELPPPGK